jgi:hypothetical protein
MLVGVQARAIRELDPEHPHEALCEPLAYRFQERTPLGLLAMTEVSSLETARESTDVAPVSCHAANLPVVV